MSALTRRSFLMSASALGLLAAAPSVSASIAGSDAAVPFTPEMVVEQARARAAAPFQMRREVPAAWKDMTYDQYQSFRFLLDRALWAETDRSYNVDFFLPGLYFPRAVQIHSVEAGQARLVPFDITKFQRHAISPDLPSDPELGYSGLRLRKDLLGDGKKTEFCVFQGASYFRAIATGQAYGLSARGLALNTGDAGGEEFPEFIQFWMEAPGEDQDNMILHALMDSPSVSGAYRFDIRPSKTLGDPCIMDVEARLFAREELDHAGLAPLTSMFLFDATNRHRFDDFRPAVHDSEGLLMKNGNAEVLWRPLANPTRLQISSFVDENPAGFGLAQRARDLRDYNDLEAFYHRRPSLWVEPKGNWGEGAVTLVEIPADKEIYDNIVAYWRPKTPYPKGAEVSLSYRLSWGDAPDLGLPQVVETSSGERIFGGAGRIVTIEYAPHPLLQAAPEEYALHISSPHAEVSEGVLQRNPETGGMRLAFYFDPGEKTHVELRAQLRHGARAASEVWLYRWTSDA